MISIKEVKEKTNADIIILTDKTGNVLDAIDTNYETNFALMTEAVFSMCNDLLKDLTNSNLKQIMAKSTENYYIANRLQDDDLILLISSNDISKLGLNLRYMNSI